MSAIAMMTPVGEPGNAFNIVSDAASFVAYSQSAQGNGVLSSPTIQTLAGNDARVVLDSNHPAWSFRLFWSNGAGAPFPVNKTHPVFLSGFLADTSARALDTMYLLGECLCKPILSTTSRTIGTGVTTFQIPAGSQISNGDAVLILADDNADWMEAGTSTYSGTTLTVSVTRCAGAGHTRASWRIFAPSSGLVWIESPAGNGGTYCTVTRANPFRLEFTVPDTLATPGTSTTSLTIQTGTINLTTQTSLGLQVGDWVRVFERGGTAYYFEGPVAAYNSGTGALQVTSTNIGLTDTWADWSIAPLYDVWTHNLMGGKYGWAKCPERLMLGTDHTFAQDFSNVAHNLSEYTSGYPSSTSASSVTIGSSGTKNFITQTGLHFADGDVIEAFEVDGSGIATGKWMRGTVNSSGYNSGTGALAMTATSSSGSGTPTSWILAADAAVAGVGFNAFISDVGGTGPSQLTLAAGSYWLGSQLSWSFGFGLPGAMIGAGKASTFLRMLPSYSDVAMFRCNASAPPLLKNMTIWSRDNTAQGVATETLFSTGPVRFESVAIDTRNRSNWTGGSRLIIQDSDITGWGFYSNAAKGFRVLRCNFYAANGPTDYNLNALYFMSGQSSNFVGNYNTAQDLSSGSVTTRGPGRIFGFQNSAWNVSGWGNVSTDFTNAVSGIDGEQWFFDGGIATLTALVSAYTVTGGVSVITLPSAADSTWVNNRWAMVVDGTGYGQVERVTAISGNDITLASKLRVPLDTTSRVNIVGVCVDVYLAGNQLQGKRATVNDDSQGFTLFTGAYRCSIENNGFDEMNYGWSEWSVNNDGIGGTAFHCTAPFFWVTIQRNIVSNSKFGRRSIDVGHQTITVAEPTTIRTFLGVMRRLNTITADTKEWVTQLGYSSLPSTVLDTCDTETLSGAPYGITADSSGPGSAPDGATVLYNTPMAGDGSGGSTAVTGNANAVTKKGTTAFTNFSSGNYP